MICQRCGKNPATIHLVEMVDNRRRSRWLCVTCSDGLSADGDGPGEFSFGDDSASGDSEDDDTLAAFLGQVFEQGKGKAKSRSTSCSACGYTFDQFRQSNRLGCPHCYETFRRPLLGILSHMHRHVSHLGKAPANIDGRTDWRSILSRQRVALEKAIAAEDFETAARLRDEIQKLESAGPAAGDSET